MSRDIPSIRSLLGDGMPPDARDVPSDIGLDAVAWRPRGHGRPAAAVAWADDGGIHLGLFGGEPEAVTVDDLPHVTLASEWHVQGPGAPCLIAPALRDRYAWDPRGGVVASLARSLDGPLADRALRFALDHGPDALAWDLLMDPANGPDAMDFHEAHPWLSDAVRGPSRKDPYGIPAMVRNQGIDGTASTLLRWMLPASGTTPEDVESILVTLRHFRFPEVMRRRRSPMSDVGFVLAVADLPAGTRPAPVPAGCPADATAQADVAAYLAASPLLVRLLASGRSPSSILGRMDGGWAEYAAALHARCGLPASNVRSPAKAAWNRMLDVTRSVLDMSYAFAEQVAAPAVMGDGTMSPRAVQELARDVSLAFLLGEKTLPALCEVSRDWHRRADAIARVVHGLADVGHAGPCLFGDEDLGDGLFATCLRTVPDLLAEGAPGADVDGAPGLDHCVGSYADRVLDGKTAIISLRYAIAGGGYVRLSTVEVDFKGGGEPKVVQHSGRSNGPPPREAVEALPPLLDRVATRARKALLAHVPERRRPVHEAIRDSGEWEAVRDAWAFALTRPQRAMGAAELASAMRGGAA